MKQNALLAKSIKEGDEAAFELFFRAEYNNVVTFLNRYLRNSLLAQDVAQESFIALWQKRDRCYREYTGIYFYHCQKQGFK